MAKGGSFEREICKLLSKWWTGGERDDVFWRSSQSGGRATQRAKSGKTTYGSYGDVTAVDPIGEPLLKLFTIELKRGSSHSCPGDLIDYSADLMKHPWVRGLVQAVRSHGQAGSCGWLMIARRDFRRPVAYVDSTVFRHFQGRDEMNPRVRFIWPFSPLLLVDFVAVRLENLLEVVQPPEIIRCLEIMKRK